ncbi:MAG TPA: S9 family peptidase [Gemmatimonadota bacterium]|nr:S9 family peptidase [Gemmatimonadota bacterium]
MRRLMRCLPLALVVTLAGAVRAAPAVASAAGPRPAGPAAAGRPAPDAGAALADTARLSYMDVFDLEWASDPQISPDGSRIAFVRNGFDVLKDRERTSLWVVDADGSHLRPLSDGERGASSPAWSPDGSRLAYVARGEEGAEIRVRWMDTGQEAVLATLRHGPRGLAWSPDGTRLAFAKFVEGPGPKPIADMPAPPKGADWGPPIEVIDRVHWRQNGQGLLPHGHTHVFVLPAEGGTPRRVTGGPYDDGAPTWTPDGKTLVFSGNRHEDADYDPANSEVYAVPAAGGQVRALTDRHGPDASPAVSPDGAKIAYLGYDERYQGYQVRRLYVMGADGSGARVVTGDFDRSVGNPVWAADGSGLYVQYDDRGDTKVGFVTLDGKVTALAEHVGGLSIGRPYGGGSYSVSPSTGRLAFTHTLYDHPADVAVGSRKAGPSGVRRLTRLNDDVLGHRELAEGHAITFTSSYDGKEIQGWVLQPPGFDPSRTYPLVLEIHGGPYANYGDRFAAEDQLYAARGYVVLYVNPRGSTSYGEAFGNSIHLDYPDHDYQDLMSGVDAVLEEGYVSRDSLYVTGGSGGGVLTAWTVGHTDRFRAAVVAKPVINWYSWVLTADMSLFGLEYWFSGYPWDNLRNYMEHSPITYAGNVTTPTMVMTGGVDYRTPSGEAYQFYQALKLRKVPSALVRIPDASHEIAGKPSNLVAKTAYILGWFERYRSGSE